MQDFEKAIEHYNKALQLRIKVYGENNLDENDASILNNLAVTYD